MKQINKELLQVIFIHQDIVLVHIPILK